MDRGWKREGGGVSSLALALVTRLSTSTDAKWRGGLKLPRRCTFHRPLFHSVDARIFSRIQRDATFPLFLSLCHVSFGEKLNRFRQPRVNYNRSDPIKRPNLFPRTRSNRGKLFRQINLGRGYRRVETKAREREEREKAKKIEEEILNSFEPVRTGSNMFERVCFEILSIVWDNC